MAAGGSQHNGKLDILPQDGCCGVDCADIHQHSGSKRYGVVYGPGSSQGYLICRPARYEIVLRFGKAGLCDLLELKDVYWDGRCSRIVS